MAKIALEVQVQKDDPGAKHPLRPSVADVHSSYTEALDTVSQPNTLSFAGGLLSIIIRPAWRRRSSRSLSR